MRRMDLPGGDQWPAGVVAAALSRMLDAEGVATNASGAVAAPGLTTVCSTGMAGNSLRTVQQLAFTPRTGAG